VDNLEKKHGVYFLMHEDEPNIESFLKMAHELFVLGFDDNKFQRVMLLNPKQMSSFLKSVADTNQIMPSHENFKKWTFAGFMVRTLLGKIE
jgi:hypothetical protein